MNANYDPWSTHIPALASAVMKYGKRVLEIGCGWYSTPLLHALSDSVTTLETDASWASKFRRITGDKLHIVPNIIAGVEMFRETPWDVVFVDCDPVSARAQCVATFLNKPCCVVAHDSEVENYRELLKTIKFVRHFDFIMPRTSHLSNALDVR